MTLTRCLPSEFRTFLEHIEGCTYADRPDYSMLRGLIKQAMARRDMRESDPFDWELPVGSESQTANAGHPVSTPATHHNNGGTGLNNGQHGGRQHGMGYSPSPAIHAERYNHNTQHQAVSHSRQHHQYQHHHRTGNQAINQAGPDTVGVGTAISVGGTSAHHLASTVNESLPGALFTNIGGTGRASTDLNEHGEGPVSNKRNRSPFPAAGAIGESAVPDTGRPGASTTVECVENDQGLPNPEVPVDVPLPVTSSPMRMLNNTSNICPTAPNVEEMRSGRRLSSGLGPSGNSVGLGHRRTSKRHNYSNVITKLFSDTNKNKDSSHSPSFKGNGELTLDHANHTRKADGPVEHRPSRLPILTSTRQNSRDHQSQGPVPDTQNSASILQRSTSTVRSSFTDRGERTNLASPRSHNQTVNGNELSITGTCGYADHSQISMAQLTNAIAVSTVGKFPSGSCSRLTRLNSYAAGSMTQLAGLGLSSQDLLADVDGELNAAVTDDVEGRQLSNDQSNERGGPHQHTELDPAKEYVGTEHVCVQEDSDVDDDAKSNEKHLAVTSKQPGSANQDLASGHNNQGSPVERAMCDGNEVCGVKISERPNVPTTPSAHVKDGRMSGTSVTRRLSIGECTSGMSHSDKRPSNSDIRAAVGFRRSSACMPRPVPMPRNRPQFGNWHQSKSPVLSTVNPNSESGKNSGEKMGNFLTVNHDPPMDSVNRFKGRKTLPFFNQYQSKGNNQASTRPGIRTTQNCSNTNQMNGSQSTSEHRNPVHARSSRSTLKSRWETGSTNNCGSAHTSKSRGHCSRGLIELQENNNNSTDSAVGDGRTNLGANDRIRVSPYSRRYSPYPADISSSDIDSDVEPVLHKRDPFPSSLIRADGIENCPCSFTPEHMKPKVKNNSACIIHNHNSSSSSSEVQFNGIPNLTKLGSNAVPTVDQCSRLTKSMDSQSCNMSPSSGVAVLVPRPSTKPALSVNNAAAARRRRYYQKFILSSDSKPEAEATENRTNDMLVGDFESKLTLDEDKPLQFLQTSVPVNPVPHAHY